MDRIWVVLTLKHPRMIPVLTRQPLSFWIQPIQHISRVLNRNLDYQQGQPLVIHEVIAPIDGFIN